MTQMADTEPENGAWVVVATVWLGRLAAPMRKFLLDAARRTEPDNA